MLLEDKLLQCTLYVALMKGGVCFLVAVTWYRINVTRGASYEKRWFSGFFFASVYNLCCDLNLI